MSTTQPKPKIPELLMPAGSLRKMRVALAYGADAVYAGAAGFSMRPDEASFTQDQLREAVPEAHALGRKMYVALNAMMFDDDIAAVRQWLTDTSDINFDALIVSDTGVFSLARELRPETAVHISTQMSTANASAAEFWRQQGAERIIVARECSLEQIADITAGSTIAVEMFVHGAMCMAVSGRCLLSAHLCGQSGSRGECKHTCRWEWQLVEKSRPGMSLPVFETGRETIFLGSTDLCLIEHISEIISSGVSSLKIEGRMKGEYYIAAVTRVYRQALDAYAADSDHFSTDSEWIDEMNAVSHRQYSAGFAFGYPENDKSSLQAANRPASSRETLGCIEHVEDAMHYLSAKNPLVVGADAEWIGPYGAGGTVKIAKIIDEHGSETERSHCGTVVSVAFDDNIELPQYAVLRRRTGKQNDG